MASSQSRRLGVLALIAAILVGSVAGIVLARASLGDEAEPPIAPEPTSVASPPAAPTRTAAPTPAPTSVVSVMPTVCPAPEEVCSFLRGIRRVGTREGIPWAFVQPHTCTSSDVRAEYEYALCRGAVVGERLDGFRFRGPVVADGIQSEFDGWISYEGLYWVLLYADYARSVFKQDMVGDGSLRLVGIGCPREVAACTGHFIGTFRSNSDLNGGVTGYISVEFASNASGFGLVGAARLVGKGGENLAREAEQACRLSRGCETFGLWRPPRAGIECPVTQDLCDLALELHSALAARDYDRLIANRAPFPIQCPATTGQLGPYPLCDGHNGEILLGYTHNLVGSEGGVGDVAGLRGGVERSLEREMPGTMDSFGPGDLRLSAIGCGRESFREPVDCSSEVFVAWTLGANTNPDSGGRFVLVLRLRPDREGRLGVSGLVEGIGLDPTMLEGGTTTVGGSGIGQPGVAAFFPWAPPIVGLPAYP